MAEIVTDSAIDFAALCGVILILRNAHWALGLGMQFFRTGGRKSVCISVEEERCFPAGTVRIGTLLLSVAALAMVANVQWLIALSLAVLLAWRWLYFAADMKYSWASMGALAALSVLSALKDGGILQ